MNDLQIAMIMTAIFMAHVNDKIINAIATLAWLCILLWLKFA